MKKPSVVFSAVGVVAAFALFVAVNYLAGFFPKRIDLTQERAFTLSEGTRAILKGLDSPVQIRLYATRDSTMPPQFKLYVQQVEDLLDEYRQASRGMVEVEKLNPEPDSEAEDSARLDGVEGQALPDGERLYLGLSVSSLDRKQAIPFLAPSRERLLEYDVSRAITQVIAEKKPVLGVMSTLPMAGQQAPAMMMMPMGPQSGRDPWVFYRELQRDFTLEEVPMTAEEIPQNVNVLLVVHPVGISAATQYAIDQFVLRGGKLIAFLDPNAVLAAQAPPGGMPVPGGGSNMEKLLSGWGITFESHKVVADMEYIGRTTRGRMPGVLSLGESALSRDDVVTADVDNLYLVYAGAFSGEPAAGLRKTVLAESSPHSQLVEPILAQNSPDAIAQSFQPSGERYAVAIRLSGKFKTAFPEGKPKDADEPKATDAEKKPEAAKEPAKAATAPGLRESAEENSVILIGDTDMLQDQIAVIDQQNPFTGAAMLLPANGNLAVAQAALEQLSGDENLIAVRSRASRERPFTVVQKMEAEAGAAYQNKILELEGDLSETQRKLAALQQDKEGGSQRFILSEEQQRELENFRKREAEVRHELKELRRNLRSDTDALETRVKWINIALAPAVVALTGLFLAAYQRKQTSAK